MEIKKPDKRPDWLSDELSLELGRTGQKREKQPIWLSDELCLEPGWMHEVTGKAGESLALAIAARLSGPIVWIGRRRDVATLAPTTLRRFIDPSRIVLTECTNRKETLWAAEQVLSSKGAPLTIIQLAMGPNLKESRRLQLACEQGGGMGLILIERAAQSSAARTRWACHPIPANDALSTPCWQWEMTKNKMGTLGRWSVRWEGGDGTTHNVHISACSAA